MPKMKSNRGARKRFKVLASGKVVRAHSHHRHILTKKSSARKRTLRHTALVHPSDVHAVKRLLPYC